MSNRQIGSTVWTLLLLFIALTAIALAGTLACAGSTRGQIWLPSAAGVIHLSQRSQTGIITVLTTTQPLGRASPNLGLGKPMVTMAEPTEVIAHPLLSGSRAILIYNNLLHWSRRWPPMCRNYKLPKIMGTTTQVKMHLLALVVVAGRQAPGGRDSGGGLGLVGGIPANQARVINLSRGHRPPIFPKMFPPP